MKSFLEKNLSRFTLLFILLSAVYTQSALKWWNQHPIIHSDVVIYYTYLPAAFLEQDLSLNYADSTYEHRDKVWFEETPDGNRVLKCSLGAALGYLPFFLLAWMYYLIVGMEPTGYELVFRVMIHLSGVVYAFAGMVLLRKWLKTWFSDLLTALILVSVYFGTQLYYYANTESALPHAFSFFLITGFLLAVENYTRRPGYGSVFKLFTWFALILLVRPANAPVFLVFIFYGVTRIPDLKTRLIQLVQQAKYLAFGGLICFVLCIPQFLYWKSVTGHFLYFSYGNERFFWTDPHILAGLFSGRKGLFIYTPIFLAFFAGLLFIPRNHAWKSALFVYFPLLIYISFSWWAWWYGGSFSQRVFVDMLALFALPFGFLLQRLYHKRKILAFLFILPCIGLNVFNWYKYRYGSIHFDSMTFQAYFYNWTSVKPKAGFGLYLSTPDYDAAREGKEVYRWE